MLRGSGFIYLRGCFVTKHNKMICIPRVDAVLSCDHKSAFFSCFPQPRDYNKLPFLFSGMIESRFIDFLLRARRLVNAAVVWIDTGRSNKAGRLRDRPGPHRLLHLQLPSPPSVSLPSTCLATLLKRVGIIINNNNKESNKSSFIIIAKVIVCLNGGINKKWPRIRCEFCLSSSSISSDACKPVLAL